MRSVPNLGRQQQWILFKWEIDWEVINRGASTTMTGLYNCYIKIKYNDCNSFYSFTCCTQQPMASYRISTNTNNSNKTTQNKTNKKRTIRKIDQPRRFKLKHDLLKISVDLQTAFAADAHLAEGATEGGKVTYVLSRNTNADCFQNRGAIIKADLI
jgi:hypothetical protein